MTIRNRTLEFLAFKNLSRYRFYRVTGLSNGFLDKEGAMTTDKCEKIFDSFPELSPEWLLTGKGTMLRDSLHQEASIGSREEASISSREDTTAALIIDKLSVLASENALLKKQIEDQERLIVQLRSILSDSGIIGYEDLFRNLTSESELAAEH